MPDLNRLTPEERYLRDPKFHALVHANINAIQLCDYTPTELREAVILAAIIVERSRARFVFTASDFNASDLDTLQRKGSPNG